jgi:hypothetical protein
LSQLNDRYTSINIDSFSAIENVITRLGLKIPTSLRNILCYYRLSISYASTTEELYLNFEQTLLSNVRRRLRIALPFRAFQLQASSFPLSLFAYPVIACQSPIFKFCLDGNIGMVKLWLKNSWVFPFVVNQHDENLLHVRLPSFSCTQY